MNGAVDGWRQRNMRFSNNSMVNADTHPFISYAARDVNALRSSLNPRLMGESTGTVNIEAYLRWLREHGYGF